ncbi:zinc finger, matrin-type 2 [Mortierella sp. GBA35]|nr:zinc finger, matrin-type 2 [Mortierella sp. AD031]KAF9101008.1 zinc finger, matrin-type 2 [Mortierella sp. GBA35]KAG0220199.1 zinc finger, matrin-type 2 [Mortierella sp. NVP41]
MSSSDSKKGAYGTVVKKKSGRWDMEEYERRAKERAAREKELQEEDEARALGKTVKRKATKEAPSEEAIAAEKSERLILESAIGKSQVVQGGPTGRAPGFYCQVCDCVLKDSTAYRDHKNGKKHLKNMGVDTKKPTRENLSDVLAKLESMKPKPDAPRTSKYDLDARLEEAKRQEDREKAEKRERKKQKKNEKKADDGFDDGGMDPAMAAMMGFSGFGSSKS